MEKLSTFIIGDKIQIQPADYIEHGWYVVVIGEKIQLYEIPYGGGNAVFIGDFNSLYGAIEYGKSLT